MKFWFVRFAELMHVLMLLTQGAGLDGYQKALLKLEKKWRTMKEKPPKNLYISTANWYETEVQSWNLIIEIMLKLKPNPAFQCWRVWMRNVLMQMQYFRALRYDNTLLATFLADEEFFWRQSFIDHLTTLMCFGRRVPEFPKSMFKTCQEQFLNHDMTDNSQENFKRFMKLVDSYIRVLETTKHLEVPQVIILEELTKAHWAHQRLLKVAKYVMWDDL